MVTKRAFEVIENWAEFLNLKKQTKLDNIDQLFLGCSFVAEGFKMIFDMALCE